MSIDSTLSHGDEWTEHYRGYQLQVSPNGDVWWQLYNGTDRLHLDPAPTDLAEDLLDVKRIGGRVRVTESNDVLTLVERSDGEYETIWIGELELDGELVPPDAPEYSIEVRPDGLSPGDLWPSVYDGSRYAYSGGDRVWWTNPDTHKRHPVETDLSADVFQALSQYKRDGGSFRITPWGEVITVIPFHPSPARVEEQFDDLPRLARNIIKLRKDRGVDMLPIYVGSIDGVPFKIQEPSSLTDEISEEEQENLKSWARNLGSTRGRSSADHESSSSEDESDGADSNTDTDGETISFDDDPIEWQQRDFDMTDSVANED